MCNRGVAGTLLIILGAIILVAAIGSPYLVRRLLKQQLQYANGTTLYTSWVKPVTRDFNIYIFNITNLDDVLNGSVPQLDEIGPYTYDEYTGPVPDSIRFSDDGNTVRFNHHAYYVFNATKTNAANKGVHLNPLTDQLIVPNVLFHSVLALCKNPLSILAPVCGLFEYGVLADLHVQPFETITPDKLIWGKQTNFSEFMNELSQGLIPEVFGLLKNNTVGRESSINTGRTDEYEVAKFITWLGQKELDAWNSKYANMINGTAGTVFRPYLDRDDVKLVYAFVDQVNRSFDLQYTEDVKVDRITCRRYVLPESEMENATQNPEQAGWFAFGPSGLLNISFIQGGFPIFVSKPHFLHGEPQLRDNASIHASRAPIGRILDTALDVEPITGVTLNAVKTLQTNLYIEPYSGNLADVQLSCLEMPPSCTSLSSYHTG
ncbi:lysosome membrane protein 2-like isoform X2 [Sycon ciliatum]|uniref:lysosome membrane protein 2-like isoform X2 n=1 Tax=Sycon ciliatum TaxID=27933 RepID=UPI0020ADC1BE